MADVRKLDLFDQFEDNDGLLLAGGKIVTYASGTTTPLVTYSDKDGINTNENPIILDGSGRCEVWIPVGVAYRLDLTDADDVLLDSVDGVKIDAPYVAPEVSTAYQATWEVLDTDPSDAALLGNHPFTVGVSFPANPTVAFHAPSGSVNTSTWTCVLKDEDGVTRFTITVPAGGATASCAGAAHDIPVNGALVPYKSGAADATLSNYSFAILGFLTV